MIININGGNGGGGGGSYTLPIASASVLGGVKIGSGLTIDNAGKLSVSGGSAGESNYVIVDALSAVTEPQEGISAWVKPVSGSVTWNRVYISDYQSFIGGGDSPEDFLARIHWGDWDEQTMGAEDLLTFQIYQSGQDFHWDWQNDGNVHTREFERDGNYYKIEYRTHNDGNENSYFEWRPVDQTPWGDYIASVSDYVANSAITETVWSAGANYTYTQNEWLPNGNVVVFDWDNIAPSTSAETSALREMFVSMIGKGFIPSILREGHILNYAGHNSLWVNFESVHAYNSDWYLYLCGTIIDDNGFDGIGIRFEQGSFVSTDRYQHTINLSSAGTFDNPDSFGKFSEENHMDEIIFRIDGDNSAWSQAPLKYVYRKVEQIDGEDKLVYYWSVEIPVDGVLYKGAWHATERDWGNYTTDSWAAV